MPATMISGLPINPRLRFLSVFCLANTVHQRHELANQSCQPGLRTLVNQSCQPGLGTLVHLHRLLYRSEMNRRPSLGRAGAYYSLIRRAHNELGVVESDKVLVLSTPVFGGELRGGRKGSLYCIAPRPESARACSDGRGRDEETS